MKISTKSQYGLRAMTYLAKFKGQILPLKIISKKENISFDYLEKIISKLEKAGLVRSKRGMKGGYYLARDPAKIKIGEIIEVLEGTMDPVKCVSKKTRYRCPKEKKCLIKPFWEKFKNSLSETLNSFTLADLVIQNSIENFKNIKNKAF